MRHLKRGRKLNRSASHRKAMLRNMVVSLFEHGRVVTTPAKAKEARPLAERLITIAKQGGLAQRRRAIAALNDKRVVAYLFDEIAPRYAARPGGYCRILHMDGNRIGDGGDRCLFELVEEEIRGKKGGRKQARPQVKVEPAEESSADAPPAPEGGLDTAESTGVPTAVSQASAPSVDEANEGDPGAEKTPDGDASKGEGAPVEDDKPKTD